MKRLTIRNSDGSVSQPTNSTFEKVFIRLAEYEDTGLEPVEIKSLLEEEKILKEIKSRISRIQDNLSKRLTVVHVRKRKPKRRSRTI